MQGEGSTSSQGVPGGVHPTSRLARLHRVQWAIGIVCVVCVLAAWRSGVLERLELPTIDLRTQVFHRSASGASASVVVMGIDDAATDPEALGRWPWDRAVLARGIDELRRAGAKTIALDILLDEPQADGAGDGALAAAMREHSGVVLPFRSRSQAPAGAVSALSLATDAETRRILEGFPADVAAHIIAARINKEAASPERVLAAIPDAVSIVRARERSSFPAGPAGMTRAADVRFPLPVLGDAAALLGDVSVGGFDPDGVLRQMRVVTSLGPERWWGSFSLAAVAHYRDTPMDRLRVGEGGEISIPAVEPVVVRTVPPGFDVPVTWPRGGTEWLGQFEAGSARRQEVSFLAAFEAYLLERATQNNLELLERLLELAQRLQLGEFGAAIEKAREARATPIMGPGWLGKVEELSALATPAAAGAAEFLEFAGEADLATVPAEDAATYLDFTAVSRQIPAIIEECRAVKERITAARTRLRETVGDKLLFVGWTASGAVADAVNTSLGPRTPGVYIHAAAASSMLTGRSRLPVPPWVDGCLIALVGAGGILAARRSSVWMAPLLLVCVVVAWFFIAGAGIWDGLGRRAAVAAPSVAAASAWLGVLLHRLLVEQRLRRRTEERFRAYVSPDVVDELVNNPEQDSMTPQRRELSIMFCDVTGFTAIAERLGAEGTARFLSAYLGKMTDTLLRHNATIDKYLGDGIMAFWGAPIPEPRHARNACRAAISLARAVAEVAAPEAGRLGPGPISIRIGIAAGDVMVGDFGNPPVRSSYTVLGDACNVAARLERASKLLGTTVLASASVRASCGEGFLWRPLGAFVLHGRQSAELVFELMGMTASGGKGGAQETLVLVRGEDRGAAGVLAWIAETEAAVEAYTSGNLDGARESFSRLAQEHGDTQLAAVYAHAIDGAAKTGSTPGAVWLREA